MKHPERVLQRALLTQIFRGYKVAIAFHCPNGGNRNKHEAYNLKLDGVLAGVSDLIIVRPHERVGWIEVKDLGKKPSSVQVEFAERLGILGHKVHLVDSIEQIIPIIEQWKKEDNINGS